MTSFRLDSFKLGERVASHVVDGLDDDSLALKLVLADGDLGQCKLYREDVLIATRDDGVWSLPVHTRQKRAIPVTNISRLRPVSRMARSTQVVVLPCRSADDSGSTAGSL
jgi:hypothetical protein